MADSAVRTSMTSIDLSRRDTQIARHSCVNSSMMLSRRSVRRPQWQTAEKNSEPGETMLV